MEQFTQEDIEEVKRQLSLKKEKVKFWREFSLKSKNKSILKQVDNQLKYIDDLLANEKNLQNLLVTLNTGKYEFAPFNLFLHFDKYFLKSRLTINIPTNSYKDFLVCKLLANKLKNLKDLDIPRSIPRRKAVKSLFFKLREYDDFRNLAVLRGDFRSYTQNIPRTRLLQIINNKQIPPHIIALIKNFLETENNVSIHFYRNSVKKFFDKLNFSKEFENDVDFKSTLNIDGILPGAPLSNILGNIFLSEFDKMIESLVNEEGYYVRYFDDFLILYPLSKASRIEREILGFLSHHYFMPLRKIESSIVRLDLQTGAEKKFDFLGYLVTLSNEQSINITIRYKSLKKFLYKYLFEYRFKTNKKSERLSSYLIKKNVYLKNWIFNFKYIKYINDLNLLDMLYIKFILPDLYRVMNFDENKVEKLKSFFKPVIIYRQLLKIRNEKKFQEEIRQTREKLASLFKEI